MQMVSQEIFLQIKSYTQNKFYPQVGSITMDQMMVDITGSNEIKIGSTMILLGSDGDKQFLLLIGQEPLILFLGKFFVLLKIDCLEFKLIRHFDKIKNFECLQKVDNL